MLTQRRLAELADTNPNHVQRWVDDELLERRGKAGYAREDLSRAAALAALWRVLPAALATVAWGQVAADLDDSGERLEVVVRPRTDHATIVRSRGELDAAITRNEPAFVVDLRAPISRATRMYDELERAHS